MREASTTARLRTSWRTQTVTQDEHKVIEATPLLATKIINAEDYECDL